MDRHGRAYRADGDPRRRPSAGFRVAGRARFRRLVADAVAALPAHLAGPVKRARLVVQEVPPEADTVVLAVFSDDVLTVYRRPVEQRADSRSALEDILVAAIGRAAAAGLGLDDDAGDLGD